MISSVASSSTRFAQLRLVVAILCISTSLVSSADIDGICLNNERPALCRQLLNSIPDAASLDVKTLGKIVISKAIVNATATENLINSHLSNATGPQFKKNLLFCSESFRDVVKGLQKAQADFDATIFRDVPADAGNAGLVVDHCFQAIESFDPSLSASIDNVDTFCKTIVAIAENI